MVWWLSGSPEVCFPAVLADWWPPWWEVRCSELCSVDWKDGFGADVWCRVGSGDWEFDGCWCEFGFPLIELVLNLRF